MGALPWIALQRRLLGKRIAKKTSMALSQNAAHRLGLHARSMILFRLHKLDVQNSSPLDTEST